jgi:hypothetical protein
MHAVSRVEGIVSCRCFCTFAPNALRTPAPPKTTDCHTCAPPHPDPHPNPQPDPQPVRCPGLSTDLDASRSADSWEPYDAQRSHDFVLSRRKDIAFFPIEQGAVGFTHEMREGGERGFSWLPFALSSPLLPLCSGCPHPRTGPHLCHSFGTYTLVVCTRPAAQPPLYTHPWPPLYALALQVCTCVGLGRVRSRDPALSPQGACKAIAVASCPPPPPNPPWLAANPKREDAMPLFWILVLPQPSPCFGRLDVH